MHISPLVFVFELITTAAKRRGLAANAMTDRYVGGSGKERIKERGEAGKERGSDSDGKKNQFSVTARVVHLLRRSVTVCKEALSLSLSLSADRLQRSIGA